MEDSIISFAIDEKLLFWRDEIPPYVLHSFKYLLKMNPLRHVLIPKPPVQL